MLLHFVVRSLRLQSVATVDQNAAELAGVSACLFELWTPAEIQLEGGASGRRRGRRRRQSRRRRFGDQTSAVNVGETFSRFGTILEQLTFERIPRRSWKTSYKKEHHDYVNIYGKKLDKERVYVRGDDE